MDRRRALAALLILAASLAAGAAPRLREAQWIAPGARFEQTSVVEAPCIGSFAGDPLFGAVAFEDPLLLGGQAARAGLSCASCHRAGRGNPGFAFPGISGAAGTADVTASLFSSHRGDGVFNPRPIPDLTFDPPKVSHDRPGQLEAFIRGLIVEEFDGAEPPPRLLESLAAYVRALDPAACRPRRGRDLLYDIARYAMALEMAAAAADAGDRDLALAMLRAARSRLGTVAERYPGNRMNAARAPLNEADAAIAGLQEGIRSGGAILATSKALKARHGGVIAWSQPLQRAERKSLYDRRLLAKALAR